MDLQNQSNHYVILKTLGQGYTSSVKLALDPQANYVAVKQYKPQSSTQMEMIKQANIIKSLQHPHIAKVIDAKQNAILTHKNGQKQQIWAMVMEYLQGGPLIDYIWYVGRFNEYITRAYFHQIISAMDYMHKMGYVHRDLKPHNILLSHNFHIKIADFGLASSKQGKNHSGILNEFIGTKQYMAPEIHKGAYQGEKVDIFATGIILFYMYTGNLPYSTGEANDYLYNLLREKKYAYFWNQHQKGFRKTFFTNEFKDLIEKMLDFDPQNRITIDQIKKHQWVKGKVATESQIYTQMSMRKQQLDLAFNEDFINQQEKSYKHPNIIHQQGNYSVMRTFAKNTLESAKEK